MRILYVEDNPELRETIGMLMEGEGRAITTCATAEEALEMVRILVQGHEAVARTARELFPMADKASDEPTADLLTQRMTVHEQTAWMLRSLLEE